MVAENTNQLDFFIYGKNKTSKTQTEIMKIKEKPKRDKCPFENKKETKREQTLI